MKKVFSSLAASALLFGATAAHADTRPSATEFSQPVSSESELEGESEALPLILLGIAGLIGILLAAGSSSGNSPR
ncbi:hypothetical protein [Erythrobacter litoralis]|uniref:Secreted protein n=1 Tax=Erythrobacter litoralis (strain HTCC2594) TaxID=314225 RepID=Q2N6Z9_ERYLH|nr:hypothetical protein [Erythrobacter litoralis]ABC64542.1 hypothetical protein ELI_12250 [Erythrobacter litoralis HTCC2594]